MSYTCLSVFTTLRPLSATRDERLSACRLLFAQEPKNDPVNWLPPSFGTTLTTMPPALCSADEAPTSTVTSCVPAKFGCRADTWLYELPMPNPSMVVL